MFFPDNHVSLKQVANFKSSCSLCVNFVSISLQLWAIWFINILRDINFWIQANYSIILLLGSTQFSRIKCWDKWSCSSIKHTCVHIIFPKHQPKNKSPMVYARFEKPAQNIIDFNPQCQLAEPLLRVAQFHFPRCLWLVRKARNLWCFLLWNPKHTAVKVQRDFLQRTPHTHMTCVQEIEHKRENVISSIQHQKHKACTQSKAFLLIGDKGFIISQ
jgi:hypothetical protein